MRTITTLAAVATLAVPAAALAQDNPSPTDAKNAAQECKALRKASGTADDFRAAVQELVGPKVKVNVHNAYGKCVSFKARDEAKENQQAQNTAVKACREEQKADPAAFAQKYGTGKKGRNAFGKCVSQKRKQAEDKADQEDRAVVNAARTCRQEQKADAEAFRQKYGTNGNGRNAFGKCVSQTAKAKAKA